MRKNKAKGLVLACIFLHGFQHDRKLTVNELLDADERLNAHYGRHPQVLSNTLRRYKIQGLVDRNQDSRRGHPFYYWMTEKGFERLEWMLLNRRYQYFQDRDLLVALLTQLVSVLEKRKLLRAEERLRRLLV